MFKQKAAKQKLIEMHQKEESLKVTGPKWNERRGSQKGEERKNLKKRLEGLTKYVRGRGGTVPVSIYYARNADDLLFGRWSLRESL